MMMYLLLAELVTFACAVIESSTTPKAMTRTGALRSEHTGKNFTSLPYRAPLVSLSPTKPDHFSKDIMNITKNQKSEAENITLFRKDNRVNKHLSNVSTAKKRSIVPNKIHDDYVDKDTRQVNETTLLEKTTEFEKLGIDQSDNLINSIATIDNSNKENKSSKRYRRRAQQYSPASEVISPLDSYAPADRNVHGIVYKQRRLTAHGNCLCSDTKCDYWACSLTSVPQDLPSNITYLRLESNEIETLATNAFLRYRFLTNLYLSFNKISVLEDNAFNGLSRLIILDLNNNLIGTNANLSKNIFEPLKSLKVLRLKDNSFPCTISPPYADVYLAYLHSLEELYIDNHGDQEYGLGFRNMTSLRNLTFSCECVIDNLSNTSFINLGQIQLLNIRECDIYGDYVETGAFSHLTNLTTLDISGNPRIGTTYLPAILEGLKNSNLQTLIMDNVVSEYSITVITSSLTQILPKTLTTLSAGYNNILSIDIAGVRNLPKSLRLIDLSGNYIIVDPEEIPLNSMEGLETLLINSNSDTCFIDSQNSYNNVALEGFNIYHSGKNTDKRRREIRIEKHQQRVGTRIPLNLRRVQVNLKRLPIDFLSHIDERNNIQELDLRCSLLPELDFYSFRTLLRLRVLNVGRSSVQTLILLELTEISPITALILDSNKLNDYLTLYQAPFVGLNNLVYLDISLNQINNLDQDLFYGLDNLEALRLDGNVFSRFHANISHMGQLKLLNVSNTALPNLPDHARSHIDHLCRATPVQITVDMSGCPIQCDCFNLGFLKWMARSAAFDKTFAGYKCRYPDTSEKSINDSYKETIHNLDRECAANYPVFLVFLAATVILLCVVTGSIIYRFRWKIRYLYYAAYLKVMDKHKKENHEFAYDVFVSYDSEDLGYVTRCLSPELENRGLKLLIHTRDFMAGTYIASNIVMAVAESRKTLVVLTRNLLQSTWCNYELQMATMEAVHTGRQVLMFLLKENIPNRELDVELLRHIKSNTYLPYPSPEDEGNEEIMKRFYDKLAHDLKW